jgi:metal-responsive CopG/Arc/MetJ family transcriptional regulator
MTSLRLPEALAARVDSIAQYEGMTRSQVVREAIEAWCRGQERKRNVDRVSLLRSLVTYPGSGRLDVARRSKVYLRKRFDAERARSR